ncbi:hypothetical protein J6590_067691 [Homalodisca vitripennis]|nr:hypothetical protein J6590_067691 [Homalodisca vitripennis]
MTDNGPDVAIASPELLYLDYDSDIIPATPEPCSRVIVPTSWIPQYSHVPSERIPSQLNFLWVRRLSQDNQIKQRRAWLLLGQVTAERSCPCKRPACPAIGGGSEVTFKPLVPRLSVREGFLALTSPGSKAALTYRQKGPNVTCNYAERLISPKTPPSSAESNGSSLDDILTR